MRRELEPPPSAVIDRSSPIPYYVQLKELIREQVESGQWRAGDQLPPESDLCAGFDVSRTVVRQALQELAYQGLIIRQKGRGTFVAEPKIRESLVQKLTGFYQDMAERGHQPTSQVLTQRLVPASQKLATHLEVAPGTPLVEIERLRFVGQEPIVLVTTYVPYALCPALLQADLRRQSLYAYLERTCGLVLARGRRVIEAVPASEYEAQLLQVKKGAPLIMLDSVSYLEDGRPVEYYHALHRGDRSRFEVELLRVRRLARQGEQPVPDPERLPRGNDILPRDGEPRKEVRPGEG